MSTFSLSISLQSLRLSFYFSLWFSPLCSRLSLSNPIFYSNNLYKQLLSLCWHSVHLIRWVNTDELSSLFQQKVSFSKPNISTLERWTVPHLNNINQRYYYICRFGLGSRLLVSRCLLVNSQVVEGFIENHWCITFPVNLQTLFRTFLLFRFTSHDFSSFLSELLCLFCLVKQNKYY